MAKFQTLVILALATASAAFMPIAFDSVSGQRRENDDIYQRISLHVRINTPPHLYKLLYKSTSSQRLMYLIDVNFLLPVAVLDFFQFSPRSYRLELRLTYLHSQ
jgi:hypothetical protein